MKRVFNKQSDDTRLIRDEILISDLSGPSIVVPDNQPSSTTIDSQQSSPKQQETASSQSNKSAESLLLKRITLPIKNNHYTA
ncbi:hypothetical protein KEM48_011661 [Puccinia striiformis f. sp. tritici PST-130]|nr:hypothetical protein H4Q26_012339 [Puccinia striiformis f. sp. tritici PST-130]KAI9628378.1 hypothetical protein KEM48_011661 [Puccinia striiformis f. sp. tritici PST-130]